MEPSNKICIFTPCYNENNIVEWMDYHFKCGIELIIIYDDQSDIAVKDVVSSYGKFDKNKYIILENLCPQTLSNERKDNCKYPQSWIRSIVFFKEIKQYMKDCSHCLSIDIDEYLYMGQFKNIHELINYYEPFDQLYFYWRTFKSVVKYSTSTLIDNFTYSIIPTSEYCGKCLIKLSKTEGQYSPHVFNVQENTIFYPNKNYNYIFKDIFNTYIKEYHKDSGLPNDVESVTNFYKNTSNNTNHPYIAHYRTQSIETFLKRRLIDRILLIKKNESPDKFSRMYKMHFNRINMNPENISNLLTKNPNIVEYIYDKMNEPDRDKLNFHDGMVSLKTMDDVSRYYWSTAPNQGTILNLDLYNYYNNNK